MPLERILITIGAAVALGLVGFGVVWLPRKRLADRHVPGSPVRLQRGEFAWLAPLLFGLALFGLYPLISGKPGWDFPPRDTAEWLPWIALAAGIIGVVEATVRLANVVRWLIRTAAAAGVSYLILKSQIVEAKPASSQLLWPEAIVWMVGFTGVALMAWSSLEAVTDRTRGASSPLVIIIWATAISQCIVLTGMLSVGTLAAILAAVAGPAWVISWLKPDLTLARGGAAVPVMALMAVLLVGIRLGETPLLMAIALSLVPLFARMADEPNFVESHGVRRTIVRVVLASIPAGVAVAAAAASRFGEAASPY